MKRGRDAEFRGELFDVFLLRFVLTTLAELLDTREFRLIRLKKESEKRLG
jgi:hypothetical protein